MSNRIRPTNPTDINVEGTVEDVIETVTPEAPLASITITEPKFVNRTRRFVVRNLPKVGLFTVGAIAGAAALILASSSEDDSPETITTDDGMVLELESSGDSDDSTSTYTEVVSGNEDDK